MKTLKTNVFLFIGLFFSVVARGQNDTVRYNLLERGVGLAEDVLDLLTWENGKHVVSVYPAAGYSPRTGIEIGVMPVWRMNSSDAKTARPTTLASSFQLSTKGMYEAKLDLVSYLPRNWMFWSKAQYLFLPDEFFGLGNLQKIEPFSNYDLNSVSFTADLAKGMAKVWFLGIRLDLNRNSHENIDGDLLNESVTGYKGGWANGLGPQLVYDNRNDVLYPTKGWLILSSHLWYKKELGSDFDFSTTSIDVRKYFNTIDNNSVLACQALLNLSSGNAPFYKLPSIGGKHLLRGIPHPYKYIDKKAWFTQVEWRQKLWWRIGGVVFAGTGKVMPDMNTSWFSELHSVGGIGLRFRALPKDGLNFRMDYGVSNLNEHGLFFTIREAF